MHCDPESLALYALGEDVLDDAQLDHLNGCNHCLDEVRSLHNAVALARGPGHHPVADVLRSGAGESQSPGPSPVVWGAISAELGLSTNAGEGTSPVGPSRAAGGGARVVAAPISGTRDPRSARGGAPSRPPVAGRPSRDAARRRRRPPVLALVLTACLAAALASGLTALALRPARQSAELAASLAPLDGVPSGAGDAVVTAAADSRSLQVSVSDLPPSDGYHEVWLIDLKTGQMVSLGALTGAGPATFAVPPGLDLSAYDLVDISDEPLNGDPAHSGHSLLRGSLAALAA